MGRDSLWDCARQQLSKGESYFVALDLLHVSEYLGQRMLLRTTHISATGVSSDAMVYAAIMGEEPHLFDYPMDRWDWRRCLLAYALAPAVLRERMRPTMRLYRANLDPKYRCWWRVPKAPSWESVDRLLAAEVAA